MPFCVRIGHDSEPEAMPNVDKFKYPGLMQAGYPPHMFGRQALDKILKTKYEYILFKHTAKEQYVYESRNKSHALSNSLQRDWSIRPCDEVIHAACEHTSQIHVVSLATFDFFTFLLAAASCASRSKVP